MKTRFAMLAVVVLAMWGLKRYYADAPVDDLGWILTPTTRLVTSVTGVAFDYQPGEGYVSGERLFLIAKPCAGINFMIAAFGMMAWMGLRRATSALAAADVIVLSLVTSYVAAIAVNAVRIAAALWLGAHHVEAAWLTPAQFHRIEGIVFYFGGLLALYDIVRWFEDSDRARVPMAPLVCYYAMTIAVPIANGSYSRPGFAGHVSIVALLPLALTGLLGGVHLLITRAKPSTA
jgi:exosortase K